MIYIYVNCSSWIFEKLISFQQTHISFEEFVMNGRPTCTTGSSPPFQFKKFPTNKKEILNGGYLFEIIHNYCWNSNKTGIEVFILKVQIAFKSIFESNRISLNLKFLLILWNFKCLIQQYLFIPEIIINVSNWIIFVFSIEFSMNI